MLRATKIIKTRIETHINKRTRNCFQQNTPRLSKN